MDGFEQPCEGRGPFFHEAILRRWQRASRAALVATPCGGSAAAASACATGRLRAEFLVDRRPGCRAPRRPTSASAANGSPRRCRRRIRRRARPTSITSPLAARDLHEAVVSCRCGRVARIRRSRERSSGFPGARRRTGTPRSRLRTVGAGRSPGRESAATSPVCAAQLGRGFRLRDRLRINLS